MTALPEAEQPANPVAPPAQRHAVWLLAALSALAFMDRQILAVLVEPIKQEFALSDLQVGLVTGLGFSLCFALIAVPLGRLADRRERVSMVVVSRAVGGALAAMGAMTGSAWALAATRAGAAVSDAGAGPASMSVIVDLVPTHQRSHAMSIFTAGNAFGSLLAMAGGAWLAQRYGWRATLACVGTASMAMAAVLRWRVVEPPRARHPGAPSLAPSVGGGAARDVWARPAAKWLLIGGTFALLAGYSFGAWNFTYLMRAHGLSSQAAGLLAGGAALASVAGGLAAGTLTDRLMWRDGRWQIGVPVLSLALAMPSGLVYLALGPTQFVAACVGVLVFSFFVSAWGAPVYAALSLVVPAERRATANAMLLLSGAVVGSGIGPVLTGALSDGLRTWVGPDGLRWALALTVCLLAFAIAALLKAMPAFSTYRTVHGEA